MIMQMFTVYDKKVGAFLPPFFARSEGEALRSFMDACQDGSHQFCKHAEDFALMRVGEFDDSSGLVVSKAGGPEMVIQAFECVKVVP